MALRMSQAEREAFLAEPRVGIIGIDEQGRSPRVVPVWFRYVRAEGVIVVTREASRKTKLLREAGRFSLCVQDTSHDAYRHVSVQGPIVEMRACDLERDYRPLARRYLAAEDADEFVSRSWTPGGTVFVMRPEHWVTADLSGVLSDTSATSRGR